MIEKTVTVSNRAGIHARPSAMIVQLLKNFTCDVYFERDDERINAKSIMGVITLGAAYGTEFRIVADGPDEAAAVEAVVRLMESKFSEELREEAAAREAKEKEG